MWPTVSLFCGTTRAITVILRASNFLKNSLSGNLKVTKHRSDEKKCILAYRDRRFQNRLSNKEDKFKNLCLGSFWATWAEWTTVPRKSRPNGQITQSRRWGALLSVF